VYNYQHFGCSCFLLHSKYIADYLTSHLRDHFIPCCHEIPKNSQFKIVFMLLSWTVVGSSHTFPSEGSPNHQPSNKDDWKNADCKSNSGGEGRIMRIAPDPPQVCGTPNRCCADEERSSNSGGLKDGVGRRYSLVPGCIILYHNWTCMCLVPKDSNFLNKL
jgi:hypothetical protein